MKRTLVSLAVAMTTMIGVMYPSHATTANVVRLKFTAPDGSPLANATVGVYLHPFDHPVTFIPTRLVLQETNPHGHVRFNLATREAALLESKDSVGGWVNVEVRALDKQRRFMVSEPMMLPVGRSFTKTLTADIDLRNSSISPSRSIAEIFAPTRVTGCEDADPYEPMCQKLIGKRKRPVKIASLHVSQAMKGTFVFGAGRETDHETLVRVCYPNNCEAWQAGQFVRENKSRSSSSQFPTQRGPWRRVMRAVYEERRYKMCSSGQSSFENCEVIREYWEPHIWTGGLNTSRPRVPDYVKFNDFYGFKLGVGEVFRTRSQNNQTYGSGLTLLAVQLRSQTGYSDSTALRWRGTRGCKTRWLYGHKKQATEAGVIYARSAGCR